MKALILLLEALVFPFGAIGYCLSFLFSARRSALTPLAEELPERFGRPAVPAGLERPVWIHCASAGEVNAAAALIARLDGRGVPVVVTSTTASGRDRARTALGAKAAWLAPLDFFPAVERFLSAAVAGQPVMNQRDLHRASTSRYTASIWRADRAHENSRARRGPASRSRALTAVSVRARSMPSAMASVLVGSTSSAASPATSGSDETFEVTTGVPHAMASSGGSPNPS